MPLAGPIAKTTSHQCSGFPHRLTVKRVPRTLRPVRVETGNEPFFANLEALLAEAKHVKIDTLLSP